MTGSIRGRVAYSLGPPLAILKLLRVSPAREGRHEGMASICPFRARARFPFRPVAWRVAPGSFGEPLRGGDSKSRLQDLRWRARRVPSLRPRRLAYGVLRPWFRQATVPVSWSDH